MGNQWVPTTTQPAPVKTSGSPTPNSPTANTTSIPTVAVPKIPSKSTAISKKKVSLVFLQTTENSSLTSLNDPRLVNGLVRILKDSSLLMVLMIGWFLILSLSF